jgi:hypothetical protein
MDHDMHLMHRVSDDARMETDESMNCCLDGSVKCSNDCSMGMGVSIIMPIAIALSVPTETAFRTLVTTDLVVRNLAPPVRPPAYL